MSPAGTRRPGPVPAAGGGAPASKPAGGRAPGMPSTVPAATIPLSFLFAAGAGLIAAGSVLAVIAGSLVA
ncbi:MAG: hypothetical protein ACYDH5_12180 [Acidimicrobiales bacterium]